MTVYTCDQLLALNHNRPPPRAVRKTLFTTRLWLSASLRHVQAHRCVHITDTASRDLLSTNSSTVSECDASVKVNINNGVSDARQVHGSCGLDVGYLNVQSLPKPEHAIAVHETIEDKKLDVFVLTETWHRSSDDISLRLAAPTDYSFVEKVRESDPRHGGIAIYYRSCYKCVRVNIPQLVTFEALCVRLVVAGESFLFLAIYRPGSSRPANQFYDELAAVLEELVVLGGPITIGGDINIHVEKPDDPDAVRFAALLASFDLVQHVSGPTHKKSGTLDLVMSFSDREVTNICVDPAGVI